MGVTGLWTVVAPTARPTKLETLNRKRLAVDASIWIYQFLKAVRDKEGNALRNSHVVGFFRRICKLLYFGIKPVFVFDGGAPILKRETIKKRARRREGRRDDAARTAGKLLAVQVARAAEDEAKRQKEARQNEDEEVIPEDQDLVYVDEIGMNQQQRQAGRTFRKQDQYHLPELNVSLEEMGAPNDPRIMSQAELEAYAKQFHSGEDINLYDFSKIDFDSPFFQSLPAGDKYNILNAARLRSRLRMGYSKEQLDGMFPDRMAFSRFQIERVKERNELTQRLMHVSGMNEGDWDKGGRIAGERGAEYVLVRNDGVEGGWALGVVSNKKGSKKDDAIDLEEDDQSVDDAQPSEEDEDEDFEDVEIEGVNRIPQVWKRKRARPKEDDYDLSYEEAAARIAKKRKAVYEARKQATEQSSPSENLPKASLPQSTTKEKTQNTTDDTLFVAQDGVDGSEEDDVFEDVAMADPLDAEDDELQKAIAMSLELPEHQNEPTEDGQQVQNQHEEDDDEFDLQAALAKSNIAKPKERATLKSSQSQGGIESRFGGPLPFEPLNLGQSLLGKKKAKKVEEDLSGGFDREAGDAAFRKQIKPQPMPDWFTKVKDTDSRIFGNVDRNNNKDLNQASADLRGDVDESAILHQQNSREVIDLDNETPSPKISSIEHGAQPMLEEWDMADDDEQQRRQEEADQKELEAQEVAEARRKALDDEREKRYEMARRIALENEDPQNSQVVEIPPKELPALSLTADSVRSPAHLENLSIRSQSDEEIEWSDSDRESDRPSKAELPPSEEPAGGRMPDEQFNHQNNDDEDENDEDVFEDVKPATYSSHVLQPTPTPQIEREVSAIDQSMFIDVDDKNDETRGSTPGKQMTGQQNVTDQDPDYFDDDSDEELMRQLANEAEEHLRFANELNNSRPKSPGQAMRDYENELKQLRNQQKKDRRDADEVTQQMIQECQALLRLFGLPYITAPMEAEAQCAELVHLGLVDGIVTDDSDIFLFGGTRIYKNMFNAAKFVECYLSADLEKEYALTRRKLIRFAHLLGSDYTEGIPGIGPVTALDIVSDFPDLVDFKEWTLKVQLGVQTPTVMEGLLTTAFRRKFKRTVQRKLFLPTTFPDLRVDQAYLEPEVDSSPEEFQWGVPDLDKLRSFLMATIGWSQERTDEILVPVIRDMNQREVDGVQSNITRYFAGGVGIGAAPARGINGYNVPRPNEADVEGTAPRNRTGKESGRMRNAYTRLRHEAEKQRRIGRESISPERQALSVDSATDSGRDQQGPEADAQLHGQSEDDVSKSAVPRSKRKSTPRRKTKQKQSVSAV